MSSTFAALGVVPVAGVLGFHDLGHDDRAIETGVLGDAIRRLLDGSPEIQRKVMVALADRLAPTTL